MRFDTIEEFDIEELLLDEGNYRIHEASDQDDCIYKIYAKRPKNFRNMMKSLADDDLGEVLLVYRDPKAGPIVYDGNRRLSALKVLHDPSKAPAPIVRKEATELAEKTSFDFSAIQAQVTDDRQLALKTVFERHAGSTGVSQISWTALANATFRFEQNVLLDEKEWREIAILMEAVHANEEIAEFVYNGKYSHDVFRRIMRSAFQLGALPNAMFSERNKRINKSPKARFQQVLALVIKFLQGMEAGEITLSRGDSYADKRKVDTFVKSFLTPEDEEDENDEQTDQGGDEDVDDSGQPDGDQENSEEQASPDDGGENSDEEVHESIHVDDDEENIKIDDERPTRIKFSNQVVQRLNRLDSKKLNSLAYSLEKVSLRKHPAMVMVSAWSFWETVARSLGAPDGTSFDSFLNGKMNYWFSTMRKNDKKPMKNALETISKEGNSNKHCKVYFSIEPTHLLPNFQVLEPLLVKALDELIEEKEAASS